MPNFSDLVDAYKKIPSGLFFSVALLLAFIIFMPLNWADLLGISEFRINYRIWIGPAFLLVLAMLSSHIFSFLKVSASDFQLKRERIGLLTTLTHDEKDYLREFIDKDTSTISKDISDGVIGSLNSKGIVYRTSNIGLHYRTFPFSLQPWARALLKKKTKLLG